MLGMITERRAIQKGIESGRDFLQGRRCSGIRTPSSFRERLFPGRVEMKGAGKVFGERMVDRGFFCRRQERDDAHGHIRRAEFGKHLTAGATWMGRRIGGTAANHEREEMSFSFGDRLEDGSPLAPPRPTAISPTRTTPSVPPCWQTMARSGPASTSKTHRTA